VRPTTTYVSLLGAVLARHRRLAGRSQAELAALIEMNQAGWSKIERGATGVSVEYLVVLAPALGAEPGVILGEADRTMRYAEAQGVQVFQEAGGYAGGGGAGVVGDAGFGGAG
jgi:transcriptional regulator with XRE-family HTH domain